VIYFAAGNDVINVINAVVASLPASTLAPLQRVLHAAACTVMERISSRMTV